MGKIFKQAIPKYIKFKSSGVTATEIVADYASYFPQTFRNEEIYSILGEMLGVVVNLKINHQLREKAKPIEYLNQHVQGWQEQFPLPINNEVSSKLLSEMITTAVAASDIKSKAITVHRFLSHQYHLEMTLEFERFIALKTIFSGIPEESIPLKLEVEIICDNKHITSLGYALKTNKDTPCLRMPCLKYAIAPDKATLSHVIRFKHLSEIIKEISLIGAENLDNEVPWIFSLQNDQWVLDGTASVSTRAKQVRILYPESLRCEAEHQTVITAIEQKKLIEASGIICLIANSDTTYTIRTGQSRSAEYYYLDGVRLPFISLPQELYIGLPKLKCLNTETDVLKEIPITALVAKRLHSSEVWKPLSKTEQGVYEIRYLEMDGSIKFRKKCVLLPENFLIRLKPQRNNSVNGSIYLESSGEAELICETAIRHNISKIDETIQLELFADDIPPSFIRLNLRWKGLVDTLILTIPFPAQGGLLISPEEQRLPENYPLFADNLYGFRLYLLNENPTREKELQVELTLVDDRIESIKDLYFRHNIKYKGSVIEIAMIDYLEWIKALLSVTQNLDSYIKLTIYQGGFPLMTINIYQYQMSLNRNTLEGSVDLAYNDSTQCSQAQISGVKLKAMRLSQPEERHIELVEKFSENTQVGSWFFYPEKRMAEPWLIYPCLGSEISFRPILWIGKNGATTPSLNPLEISTLHSAVMIEPLKLRALVINKILAEMCFDFNHSGWEYLKILAKETEHLPLNSFDVWSLVVANHQVLAATVLQMDQDFIEKLDAELPVFWELITLAEWLTVFNQYQLYLQKARVDDTDIKKFIESRIKHLYYLPQSMETIIDLLMQFFSLGKNKKLNISTASYLINAAKNKLQEKNDANSIWFKVLNNELNRHWDNLEESERRLLSIQKIDYHFSTFTLPVLLAHFCLKSVPKSWSADVVYVFKLKQLKSFDEEWFNSAFRFSLLYLSQLPENTERLHGEVENLRNINDVETQLIEQEIIEFQQRIIKGEQYANDNY